MSVESAVLDLAAGLRARVEGEVIGRGDPGYDEARQVWNGMVDHHPTLIVRSRHVQDVVEAVRFAREHALPLTVRGGGHHVAGGAIGNDALVVDLTLMREVEVEPDSGIVRVQGGATLADVDAATYAHGFVVPSGVVSKTGIAGLTLGGGLGWLRRKHGLTIDNLRAAEVVTPDGTIVRASADEHPDLFWGLRGGGGAFGVVTTFEFQAHPVGPEVAFAFVFHPIETAHDAIKFLRDYSECAPDEVSAFAFLATVPDSEEFPEEHHGKPSLVFAVMYAGDVDEGERELRQFREFATPLVDLSARLPFTEVQRVLDEDYPDGRLYYWKAVYLSALPDAAIDVLLERFAEVPSSLTTIDLWQLGGAIDRVGAEDTAFPHRGAAYLVGIESNWDEPEASERNVAWTRKVASDLEPYSTGGRYGNLDADAGDGQGSGGAAQRIAERLAEVKRRWDPDGLFQPYRAR